MSYNPRKTNITIVDSTLYEKVIWEAELDDLFYCYVIRYSTDLYALCVEDIDMRSMVMRQYFTHEGRVTTELVQQWHKQIESVVDQKYQDDNFFEGI